MSKASVSWPVIAKEPGALGTKVPASCSTSAVGVTLIESGAAGETVIRGRIESPPSSLVSAAFSVS